MALINIPHSAALQPSSLFSHQNHELAKQETKRAELRMGHFKVVCDNNERRCHDEDINAVNETDGTDMVTSGQIPHTGSAVQCHWKANGESCHQKMF